MSRPTSHQSGIALMMLVFMVAMIMVALTLKQYDANKIKQAQLVRTQQSLAIAKQALIAYSLRDLTVCTTSNECRRPGEMPCPDLTNNGEAAKSCNANRLGRLPWKTLGIDDLRDGANERLWYALSKAYANKPKQKPLNTAALGAISLRGVQGTLRYDATSGNGLVALIIAPGQPLTRQDGLFQSRSSSNVLNAPHYLDIAFGENNADFVDNATNGFITGNVIDSGRVIVNDVVALVTMMEVNKGMQNKVLIEVNKALSENLIYPDPAIDSTCSNVDIADTECASDSSLTSGTGLIPVGDGSVSYWATSILHGQSSGNWFQQNGWRGLISYNREACVNGDIPNCVFF